MEHKKEKSIPNLLFELTKSHNKRRRNRIRATLKSLGVRDIDQQVALIRDRKEDFYGN